MMMMMMMMMMKKRCANHDVYLVYSNQSSWLCKLWLVRFDAVCNLGSYALAAHDYTTYLMAHCVKT